MPRWEPEHAWFFGRWGARLRYRARERFLPLRLSPVLPTVNPSRGVLIQMGVRVQLEHQIGSVDLGEG